MDDFSLLVVTSQISGQALYLGGAGPTRGPASTSTFNDNALSHTALISLDFLRAVNTVLWAATIGNGSAAIRLYGERYPTRQQPNHQTFTQVQENLVEHGRTARSPIFEEGMLHAVN
ncbi:hypothetical protein TNCV_3986691 [Trichonephila clavipes]|nr:hypothetical protein TNCV_3986691 [Trichonephila clavipes]